MNKINCTQFSSIIIMLILSSFLGVGIFSLIKASGIDAYLSIILGGIIGSIFIYLFITIFNYEPSLTLKDKINKLFGKKIGFILNFILFIIIFSMGTSSIFNLTIFISSQFLPETPLLLIALVFSFLVIFINTKGIDVISKTSFILVIINLIFYLFAFIGLIPSFDISNIKPFLEHGLNRPLKGAIFVIGFNIIPIFLLLMIPKNIIVDKKKINKHIIIAYLLGIILMTSVLFLTLGVLGIYLSSIYQYPEYIVLKNINIFNFIDRIENIITSQWIFSLFINLTMIIYFLSNSIKTNNKSKIIPTFLCLSILFISKKIFSNNTQFNNYTYKYSLINDIIILLILIIIFIKIKKLYFKTGLSNK